MVRRFPKFLRLWSLRKLSLILSTEVEKLLWGLVSAKCVTLIAYTTAADAFHLRIVGYWEKHCCKTTAQRPEKSLNCIVLEANTAKSSSCGHCLKALSTSKVSD